MTRELDPERDFPAVLCLSGLDPSGGAGIAADITTVASLGGHPLPLVTAITTQDTRNIKQVYPVDPDILKAQIALLEKDIGFDAIKIGLISEAKTIEMIGQFLRKLPDDLPVIVDPIVAAGGGFTVLDENLLALYLTHIVPYATVITPNAFEARTFAPSAKSLKSCASFLLKQGAQAVFITGVSNKQEGILTNTLYTLNTQPLAYDWPLLNVEAHGTGCTLASALATLLAFRPLVEAIEVAQHFAFHSVLSHYTMGKGQVIPNRLFWTEEDEHVPLTAANDETQ